MKSDKSRKRFVFLCVAPATILFFIFMILPTLNVFRMSLYERGAYSPNETFVGLKNFQHLLKDTQFIRSMQNMILLVVVVTIITFAFALVFAAILTREKIKGQNFFRIIFYIPNILSVVVITGIFPEMRTTNSGKVINMGVFLQIGMFVAAGLILVTCRPKLANAMSSSIMRAGITAVITVFGLSWMSDTFISAHKAVWVEDIGGLLQTMPWLFAFVIFFGSMLLNSQAATVRAVLPLGFALGMPAPTLLGLYPACNGTSFLPTSGVVVSTIAFDQSGTTHIGKYVINHSFLVPCVTATTTATVAAYLLTFVMF